MSLPKVCLSVCRFVRCGGGFHAGGLLLAHANLPLPTVSSHRSFQSSKLFSSFVRSANTRVDLLKVSVLAQASLANLPAASLPLIPVCAGIHSILIFRPSFSPSHCRCFS
jgi:hypothetical protein